MIEKTEEMNALLDFYETLLTCLLYTSDAADD